MPLRKFWNLHKFQGDWGSRASDQMTADEPDAEWKSNCQLLNSTIHDKMFWLHIRLVANLGYLGEYLGRWAEGCPCHEAVLLSGQNVSCQFKSCRAPELACGDAFSGLENQLGRFQQSLAPLATSASLTPEQQNNLVLLAGKVAAGLTSELRMKFAYFQQLPHCLCGLGHYDNTKTTTAAKRCLEIFDGTSPGSLHRMSKRFLDPGWNSDGEIALRDFVVRMANGESVQSIGNDQFTHWVTALASIKTVERPVEGLHSRISKLTKTSPNQSMSLISMELRFVFLLDLMKSHPELLHQCQDDVLDLERSSTFKALVRKHLGLEISLESDRAMANLLYRENLRIKHSKKNRTKADLEKHKNVFRGAGPGRSVTVSSDALIVGSHLARIACKDQNLFFLIPHSLFAKCAVRLEDVAGGPWFGNSKKCLEIEIARFWPDQLSVSIQVTWLYIYICYATVFF